MFYEDPYIVLSKSKFSYAVAVLGLNKFVIPLKAHTDWLRSGYREKVGG